MLKTKKNKYLMFITLKISIKYKPALKPIIFPDHIILKNYILDLFSHTVLL